MTDAQREIAWKNTPPERRIGWLRYVSWSILSPNGPRARMNAYRAIVNRIFVPLFVRAKKELSA